MLNQVTAIWKFRSFLFALVRLDLRLRYKRSWLGGVWSLIHPITMAATYVTVFSGVLMLSPAEYTTMLLVGLAVWGFFRECAVSGCLAIISHESYIRQHPLPFGLYSLRFVLGYAIQGVFALGVAMAAVAIDGHGENLRLMWAVVPALFLIFVTGWAVATICAFAQVYFHDTKHLLEIAAQILFFLTPIVYKPDLLVSKGLGWMARFNPLNVYLELVRFPLTAGELPDAKMYLKGAACTAVLFVFAVAIASRLRKKVVFYL
ncbi:ABC transporter permease [Gemmata sp. G18]|uniref:ABC transporter permease n=1 Tax=Gemmata palustris TaxID=2822762 RepID=A0ABS5BQR7_9BACT|nr:ABC transporter permease [Gemmata palustris]MBP3956080.1 ABC transporter permease [Gemmata palustris]